MPRFYFHLHDAISTVDPEGGDYPDLGAAQANALHEARYLISQAALQGRIDLHHRIYIADEQGAVLHRTLFRDAVEIDG